MIQKQAIRYLRISTDRQSNYSITGQDEQTRLWCERNNVAILATFTDEGFSARTFDRPDMNLLNDFIKRNHTAAEYLVVNDFTRFSRDTGEALIMIKRLQKVFSIKIVSTSENTIVDYDDPGSFFYAGLRFLQGEDEIIRNKSRINLGIFTAKTKEGRYLGAAPFGYKNTRDANNKPVIVIDAEKAPIVRYIYEAYNNQVPFKEIYRHAKSIGFSFTSHSYIQKILANPVYTGMLRVKAYKDTPAQVVEGIHDAIIDRDTWCRTQERLNRKTRKTVHLVSDDFPLRNVLMCHCRRMLTGAPSRSRNGSYYNYYKCTTAGHGNINASRAHQQLSEVFGCLSLPQRLTIAIRQQGEAMLEQSLKDKSVTLRARKAELAEADLTLRSVEEKWIRDKMTFETYQRWFTDLTSKRTALQAQIKSLSQDQSATWLLLQDTLDELTDMKALFQRFDTLRKQQLIRLVFDSQLYYNRTMYRTGYIMPIFNDNLLILKQKQLLEVDEKRGLFGKVPSGGAEATIFEPLTALLSYIRSTQVA